jgi:pSer/pThr/pTyr-binding forkhead associated (FHA) protein
VLAPPYAKLKRLSTEVPSTPSLPDEISLPEPGSLNALTFGRHAHQNDVMLECQRVPSLLSRQHAEIHCDAEGVHYVMDKNTLNGTYLNGNLIPTGPVALKDGDVVAFGGPANVLRDKKTLKNSFRFKYRCPQSAEQWRATNQAMAEAAAAAEEQDAAAAPAKRARVGESSGRPESSSRGKPTTNTNASEQTARTAPDPAAFMGLAPEGYRSTGRAVTKLSRRDVVTTRRVATKMVSRSVHFLSQALSEVGTALGESVIPLHASDENLLQGIIADQGNLFSNIQEALSRNAGALQNSGSDVDMNVMTQATQEYACDSPTKGLESELSAVDFAGKTCRDALELRMSPGGVVTFALNLRNASAVWNSENFLAAEQRAQFKRGDVAAEAAALALWPLPQLGWDDAPQNENGKETVAWASQKKPGPGITKSGFALTPRRLAKSTPPGATSDPKAPPLSRKVSSRPGKKPTVCGRITSACSVYRWVTIRESATGVAPPSRRLYSPSPWSTDRARGNSPRCSTRTSPRWICRDAASDRREPRRSRERCVRFQTITATGVFLRVSGP